MCVGRFFNVFTDFSHSVHLDVECPALSGCVQFVAPSFLCVFIEIQASVYPSLSTVQQQRSAFRVGLGVVAHNPSSASSL